MENYNITKKLDKYFVIKDTLELNHEDLMFKRQGTAYLSATTARNDLFQYLDRNDIMSNFKISVINL